MTRSKNFVTVNCSTDRFQELLNNLWQASQGITKSGSACLKNPEAACTGIAAYLDAYLSAWGEVLGKPVKYDYGDEWIVQNAFYDSFNDLVDKQRLRTFYVAHVNCVRRVLKNLSDWLMQLHKDPDKDSAQQRCLKTVFFFGELAAWTIELLQECAQNAGLPFKLKVIINKLGHHRILFDTCQQLWYGDIVQDSWASVVLIRQNLEIRIRHCVDVMGVLIDGHPTILTLTSVLEALRQEKSAISAVPWNVLLRIYKWSNLYVHTAAKGYPWLAGYAMFVLLPLMSGIKEKNGNWSVDNAIRISQDGVRRVHAAIIAQVPATLKGKSVRILSFGIEPHSAMEIDNQT